MKHYLLILLSSIMSGFCITIGASVYLICIPTNKIVGTLFFSIGLFTIIHFNLWLYTGKVGFTLENKPKYLLDLLTCVIGNFIGVIALTSLLKLTRMAQPVIEQAKLLVQAKQNDTWYSIFFLSVMCGVMIYLAVKGHQKCEYALGKVLFVFLSVSVFILLSFEHCVANAVYYTYAGYFSWKAFGYFLLMIIGNGLGSIIFDGLLKLIDYLRKPKIIQ